jgi:Epiplasmin protein
VPKKVKKVEYREERKIETIPKEVTVTDYYAVEYLRQYIPQYVPEKRIEYVQVPKKQIRYEYIPVERYPIYHLDKLFTIPINLSKSKDKPLNKPSILEKSRLQPITPEPMLLELKRDTSLEHQPHTSLEDKPDMSLEDKPDMSPPLPLFPPPTSLEHNRDTSLELSMSLNPDMLLEDMLLDTQEPPLIPPLKSSPRPAPTNTPPNQLEPLMSKELNPDSLGNKPTTNINNTNDHKTLYNHSNYHHQTISINYIY